MSTGIPVTDKEVAEVLKYSYLPNKSLSEVTGLSTQTVANIIKMSLNTTIWINKYDDGSISISTNGKPLPCRIVIDDYDHDPLSLDNRNQIICDPPGSSLEDADCIYTRETYPKGTKLS